MSDTPRERLLRKLNKRAYKVVITSDISDPEFVILCAVSTLTPAATIHRIINLIKDETGDLGDVAEIYGAIERFQRPEVKWIRETGKECANEWGFSDTMFGITFEGRTMIKERSRHLVRLQAFYVRAEALRKMTIVSRGTDEP